MNASRRYLPLSLMLLLATSVGPANAGTLLDPYSHIKAPASKEAPKKNFLQKQQPAIVPQADEVNEATTYVTMPMGHLAEENAEKKPATGLIGKTFAPFKAAGSGVAKSGKFIANGAKASGDMAKKSTTMIGFGDKNKDSKGSVNKQIASKPKAEKVEEKNDKTKKQSPSRVASVDDWYTKEAEKAISHKDNGRAADLVKRDPSKASPGMETAFLQQKGGKKINISSKLNPFNKFKKPNDKNNKIDVRPASGFADGASNPDDDVLAELDREQKAKVAAKAAKELQEGGNEPFTPIVAEPATTAKKGTQVATTKNAAAKPEKKDKKSKFGLNMNIAKFKPGMPGLPSFGKGKKKQPNTPIAAAPKEKNSELDELTEVDPVAKIDPAGEEDITPIANLKTGDKAIDAATPKGKVAEKKEKSEPVVAKKPEKKSKFGGMGIANLSKFNFMNKKKPAAPPQSATKTDAAKQM